MIGFLRKAKPRIQVPLARAAMPRQTAAQGVNVHLDGQCNRALETGRNRLLVTGAMFVLAFCVIGGRMVEVTLLKGGATQTARHVKAQELGIERADVVDRDGVLLATSLPTMSLYARPKEVADKAEAARRIAAILTDMAPNDILNRLHENRAFIYLRRNLTPRQEYDINALGIPGLYFEKGEKRIYPQGELTAHVVGLTDLDNKGIAGIERSEERELKGRREPLRLSIDVRVQTILRNELTKAVADFHAIGATGMVMDVHSGELLAMVSLPDFNPNYLSSATPEAMFNRATLGLYEMGSTFKLFNTAALLDSGTAHLSSSYDATKPLEVGGFHIHDDHPEGRWLTVPEILMYSSNIGSARMAVSLGTDNQRSFLSKIGLTRPTGIELPESGAPLLPNPWREISTMTIAFGHGMAVTPLHMMSAVAALVNGGTFRPATLIKQDETQASSGTRVIKPETSRMMCELMRLVVTNGTGSTAEVAGYEVGGKTGTAEKSGVGGYHKKALLSSFIATFPVSDPKYLVLVMLDEPKGTKETFGLAQAHWNSAPTAGHVVAQIGPLLGLTPNMTPEDAPVPRERALVLAALHGDGAKGLHLAEAQ